MRKLILLAALALPLVWPEMHAGRARVRAADRASGMRTSLDFGDVSVGDSATETLTVHNLGTGNLEVTLSSTNDRFSVVAPTGPFTVAPGGQQRVTVRFSPDRPDRESGELRITSNDPDEETVAVPLQGVGVGVGEPNISVTPNPLNFDEVVPGQSVTRELTVHNTGATDLDVTSIRIGFPGLNFIVDPPPGRFTVAPGGQRNVTVRFSPPTGVGPGVYSISLFISSNDPDAAAVIVLLRATVVNWP